jgi:6-phosphogluconolactonase (cycloisomerase 2 family)
LSSTATTGSSPSAVVVSSTGSYVYVANSGDGTISEYSASATTGALTSLGTVAAGTKTSALALHPTFPVLYALNAPGSTSGSISVYTISNGALTLLDTVTAGHGPSSLVVSPANQLAFVANKTDGTVVSYTVANTTGDLSGPVTSSTGTSPTALALDSSETFLYVAASGSNDILSYRLTPRPVPYLTLVQDLSTGSGSTPLGLAFGRTFGSL